MHSHSEPQTKHAHISPCWQ